MRQKPENRCGGHTRFLAILRKDSNQRRWRLRRKPGTENGGLPEAEEVHGTPSCTTRSWTWFTPELVTEALGTGRCARRVKATIYMWRRFWHCAAAPESWYGIFRLRRETAGTTMRRNR